MKNCERIIRIVKYAFVSIDDLHQTFHLMIIMKAGKVMVEVQQRYQENRCLIRRMTNWKFQAMAPGVVVDQQKILIKIVIASKTVSLSVTMLVD